MSFLFRKSTDYPSERKLSDSDLIDMSDKDNLESSTSGLIDEQIEKEDDQDTTTKELPKKVVKKQPTFLRRILSGGGGGMDSKESSSPSPSPSSSSSIQEIGLGPLTLKGYKDSTKHRLLDVELANNIRNLIPARLQLFDSWDLVYSMEQHGISLNTLYRHCNPEYQLQQLKKRKKAEKGFADSIVSGMMVVGGDTPSSRYNFEARRPQAYVLIIKDENNCKFGAYLNQNLKPMEHKRYYGNGECFLWKCEQFDPTKLDHYSEKPIKGESDSNNNSDTRFKAFMYTGINDNIIYSNHDFIAIGSSNGQNGIFIDKSLYKGVSYSCETFGNEILNSHIDYDLKIGRFKIMGLEIWRIGTIE
ncbi:OXR1 [[Candida] subhashii]|uniref:Oxidation resistance protein 1 n=1 Tax=[Candida] subhashii TaxID=561895 RepID=A0A8J5QJL6_9ASCO|nr:OXR1 [[Candida] subhashii]KAG7663219.1 OXR1 [[Candida] subhashii]